MLDWGFGLAALAIGVVEGIIIALIVSWICDRQARRWPAEQGKHARLERAAASES